LVGDEEMCPDGLGTDNVQVLEARRRRRAVDQTARVRREGEGQGRATRMDLINEKLGPSPHPLFRMKHSYLFVN